MLPLNREITKRLIQLPQWPLLMRHIFTESDIETTPFREMIRKMPGIYTVGMHDLRLHWEWMLHMS